MYLAYVYMHIKKKRNVMLDVQVSFPPEPEKIKIASMLPGQLGKTEYGHIILAGNKVYIDLHNPQKHLTTEDLEALVMVLPAFTTVSLTVYEKGSARCV